LARKGRLLAIGSNTGLFLRVAQDSGWQAMGVEVSKTMVEIACREFGVEAIAGDWMAQKSSEPLDVIYCSHVIEHIPDPSHWMWRFREVMALGGALCLAVPNVNSIDRRWKRSLKCLGLSRDRWERWRTPDHLYEPSQVSGWEAFRSGIESFIFGFVGEPSSATI